MPKVAIAAMVGKELAGHVVHGGVCARFFFAAIAVLARAASLEVAVDRIVDRVATAQPPLEWIELATVLRLSRSRL